LKNSASGHFNDSVGGVYTLDAKEADELIDRIEPSIILPMHYKTPTLTVNLDPLDKFWHEGN